MLINDNTDLPPIILHMFDAIQYLRTTYREKAIFRHRGKAKCQQAEQFKSYSDVFLIVDNMQCTGHHREAYYEITEHDQDLKCISSDAAGREWQDADCV